MIAPIEDANPLLAHVWGVSPSADRVWAQVAGIAPSSMPWERLFVVFRAYIDDSYTQNSTFVLGGYIATAEAWAKFAVEWEELLPFAQRNRKTHRHRFKMQEMAKFMDRVPAFYNVIADHAQLAISCKINSTDLRHAKDRIWGHNIEIDWNVTDRLFCYCFMCLMGTFHEIRVKRDVGGELANIIPLDQKVDFYFDMQSERRQILDAWDSFVASENDDRIGQLYGALPRFESDEDFLPLQAADFWAWWVRRGYENGKLMDYKYGQFEGWTATKLVPFMDLFVSEDMMVEKLMSQIQEKLGPGQQIYDAKYMPRPS